MGERVPDSLVVDPGASHLVKLPAVHVPSDGLLLPCALGAVNVDSPGVPALVGNANGATDTSALVADATGVDIAVDGAMAGQHAVDSFENVNLTAGRPASAITEGVAKHPEGGPDALLVCRGGVTETDDTFGAGDLSGSGSEDVLALHTARGPSLGRGVVSPRDELQRVTATALDVARGRRVDFELGVNVEVTNNDVPVGRVGGGAGGSRKVVLPDPREATVPGSIPGEGSASQTQEREKGALGQHFENDEVMWIVLRLIVVVVVDLLLLLGNCIHVDSLIHASLDLYSSLVTTSLVRMTARTPRQVGYDQTLMFQRPGRRASFKSPHGRGIAIRRSLVMVSFPKAKGKRKIKTRNLLQVSPWQCFRCTEKRTFRVY